MITSLKTSPDPWIWPLDCTTYDRTSTLSAGEYHALADRVQRSDAGQYCSSVDMPAVLHRLTRPLHDVLDLTGAIPQVRREIVNLLLREMYFRQLLYGVAGAREQFERLCADLIRAEFSGAKEVRCQSGDGGVDVYVGDWADPEGISVFQVKFFPLGLGSSQKDQVRRSFRTCIDNDHFTVSRWTLCLPIDLSEEETAWFTKWKHQQATNFLSVDRIDWWGESAIRQLLLQPKNVGIKEAYFHQEYVAQIREMYRILTHLLEDFATRPEESVMALALRQDAKDANLRYRDEVYGPLHTELKRIRDVLERAHARTGPYPLRIPVGGEQLPRYPRYTPPATLGQPFSTGTPAKKLTACTGY